MFTGSRLEFVQEVIVKEVIVRGVNIMGQVYSNKLAYELIDYVCNVYNKHNDEDWWNLAGKIRIKEGCISYTKYIGGGLLIELHEDTSKKKKLFGKRYDDISVSVNSIYKDIYKDTGILIAEK